MTQAISENVSKKRGRPTTFSREQEATYLSLFSILSELGRIKNDDDLRYMAQQICRLKPSAREAVAIIRRWRIAKPKEASAVDLTVEILRLTDDYCVRHPDTTRKQIIAAIHNAADAWTADVSD